MKVAVVSVSQNSRSGLYLGSGIGVLGFDLIVVGVLVDIELL